MRRRTILLISLVLAVGLVGSALAVDKEWVGGGTNSWCEPGNWSPWGEPNDSDLAVMNGTPEQGPIIDVGCDANVGTIHGPCYEADTPQQMDITGGSLVVNGSWEWDDVDDKEALGPGTLNISGDASVEVHGQMRCLDGGTATINISGNPAIYVHGTVRSADQLGSFFHVNMEGGYFYCKGFKWGDEGGGLFDMTGGVIDCNGNFEMVVQRGFAEFGFNMSGGEITVRNEFAVPANEDCNLTMYFDGGVIDCGNFNPNNDANWIADINGGEIRITDTDGSKLNDANESIATGHIIAFHGHPKAFVDVSWYPSISKTILSAQWIGKARYPSPSHGAEGLCPEGVTLEWREGEYVDYHQVYFGPSISDVNDSATPVEAHWDTNSWIPPTPKLNRTYYWRIDEVNDANADSPWVGGVWTFTIQDGNAFDPDPAYNQERIPLDANLSWTPGCVVTSHDVYFGSELPVLLEDDFESGLGQWSNTGWVPHDASADPNYAHSQSHSALATGVGVRTLDSGDLDASEAATLRIDLWLRKTNPVEANEIELYYYNGSGYDRIADLNAIGPNDTWLHYGETVTESEYLISNFRIQVRADISGVGGAVYLDDVSVINTVPTGPDWFQENLPVEVNEWDPNGFDYFKWYYWRIDEVNGAEVRRGDMWRFRAHSEVQNPHLLVWYKFDEDHEDGGIGRDYSGHEAHLGVGEWSWDPNDDAFGDGGSLYCNSYFDSEIRDDAFDAISSGITVAVWVKGIPDADEPEDRDHPIFSGGDEQGDFEEGSCNVTVVAPTEGPGLDVVWRAGNDSNDVLIWEEAVPSSWKNDWHHLAFTKDEDAGVMKIYFDGSVVDSNGTVNQTLANLQDSDKVFKVGSYSGNDGDAMTRVDDLRVYDYALSDGEVEALLRGGDRASAWKPRPYNAQVDVAQDTILIWNPGDYAVSHDVYLGTSWDDVNDANTSSDEFEANQEPNEFDPEGLVMDTTYYWRIDEVNDSNVDSPWKGKVWKFTVANFIVIDDMETYITGSPASQRIYYTWDDGYVNGTGSELALGQDPVAPVHGGDQSMNYLYDNRDSKGWDLDYYSEISVDVLKANLLIGTRDWTVAGVRILTLFFYGQADNDANATEQLYVGLEDTRGAGSYAQVNYGLYGEDNNDIKVEEWHQWDIALPDFTDVILTAVGKLYIGFGIRGNPNPGGTPGGGGTVFFDNIRLYMPKCVPWRLKPVGDFTDDCTVDLRDVREMADEWLRADACLPTEVPPSGPVGWWKFDEGVDSTANDSSASGTNDGTITGDAWWIQGRIGPYALELDGGKVLVPDAAELRPPATVSACAWINYNSAPSYDARVVVKGADENNRECYALELTEDNTIHWFVRDSNTERYPSGDSERLAHNEWIHVAGVYDGNQVKCYINGRLSASNTEGALSLLSDTNDLAIGNRADADDRAFEGGVDDVRVYDYALTDAHVAYIATESTGYVPLLSDKDLYDLEPPGRQAINFRDLDMLLDEWLVEKLWPQ